MTTIPQVARAMREILTTTADAAARTTRFVQRTSPLSGATFSQTLVFGFLGNAQATLEELTQTAATLGVAISPQALDQRFTASAAACLEQVLLAAIARVITAEPVTIPLLQRFTAVYVQDSSTIVLPEVFAAQWHGCGGSTASGTSAALKLQARLEMCTGRLDVQLQEGRASDRAAVLPGPLPAGPCGWLTWGTGAWTPLRRSRNTRCSGCHGSRYRPPSTTSRGSVRSSWSSWRPSRRTPLELAVTLGEHQRLAARLLAVRVPQDVADSRRRRLRPAARDKGRQVSATRLALAAWTLFVTNVPPERLTLREALVLGRMRWQIELLFKLWKSHGRVDESRSTKPWRILCEVYAKLLAMLVQHWVFLVSLWAYPNRSLTKAAQTVQKHALHLASAFASVKRLAEALGTVKCCLAAGCRMNRRKKYPNTYQLLLDATSL